MHLVLFVAGAEPQGQPLAHVRIASLGSSLFYSSSYPVLQELNHRGTHLLFRDKKRHLSLYTLVKQERVTLLNYTGYVQWVPQVSVVAYTMV